MKIVTKLSILVVAIVVFAFIQTPSYAATAPSKIKADATRLYDSVTGKTFQPRGANYVRLTKSAQGYAYHSTFEPGKYNSASAGAFLAEMQRYKYNTVRVFIDPSSH